MMDLYTSNSSVASQQTSEIEGEVRIRLMLCGEVLLQSSVYYG